jgi:hypothetical protein
MRRYDRDEDALSIHRGPSPHTIKRIFALETEAAAAGDTAMVAICQRAYAGKGDALRECYRVLAAAEAMQEAR